MAAAWQLARTWHEYPATAVQADVVLGAQASQLQRTLRCANCLDLERWKQDSQREHSAGIVNSCRERWRGVRAMKPTPLACEGGLASAGQCRCIEAWGNGGFGAHRLQ